MPDIGKDSSQLLLVGMLAKELCDGRFIYLPFGHREHHIDQHLIRYVRFDIIHGQKLESRGRPHAFVSV